VLELADGASVGDLYAGVGLFSIALAAAGRQVVAVEGDSHAAADLAANAAPWRARLATAAVSVERAVSQPPPFALDAVVVDPPRTGMSVEALAGLLAWRVPKVVYVSCDPPTLARDAARIVAAGYGLLSVDAFDLFPNTPHVETIAVFGAADETGSR
jgi:tRNA/tmRNA/rRNA uracil-C5-methylase (TrmA/RlmC/RlmD family)